MKRKMTYGTVPNYFTKPADQYERAANLALFLTDTTGSCLRLWSGYLKAADQRRLFGRFIGKGKIIIDGTTETVEMVVKVGFGQDFSTEYNEKWRDM